MSHTVLASPDLVALAKDHGGDIRAFLATTEGSELLAKVVEAVAAGDTITVSSLVGDLTPQQASEMLGIARPTLMKLIGDGQIKSHRVGRHHRIRVDDVLELRARRAQQGRVRHARKAAG